MLQAGTVSGSFEVLWRQLLRLFAGIMEYSMLGMCDTILIATQIEVKAYLECWGVLVARKHLERLDSNGPSCAKCLWSRAAYIIPHSASFAETKWMDLKWISVGDAQIMVGWEL